MDPEAGLEKIFACVADTVFGSYSANIHISGVEQFQNLSKRLPCIVYSFETGILLDISVAALVEYQLVHCIRLQGLVDISSAGAGYAMRRPDSSLFLERRMVCRMMVTDEEYGEGIQDFMLLSTLTFSL